MEMCILLSSGRIILMFSKFELVDKKRFSRQIFKVCSPRFLPEKHTTKTGLWGWFSVVAINSLGIICKPFHGFTLEMPKGEQSNVDFGIVRLQGMARHQFVVVRPGVVRQGSVKQQSIVVRQQDFRCP